MEENGKYLRLLGRIGLAFIIFMVSLFLFIYGLKYFFRILDSMSWFSLFFALFVICVPSLIFMTVYFIYYHHTKGHPSKGVRIFSNTVFAVVLSSWVYFFVLDIILFSTKQYRDIEHYNTYNLAFLSANVGIIFFIGIIQALTTKKEVHWMDRASSDSSSDNIGANKEEI